MFDTRPSHTAAAPDGDSHALPSSRYPANSSDAERNASHAERKRSTPETCSAVSSEVAGFPLSESASLAAFCAARALSTLFLAALRASILLNATRRSCKVIRPRDLFSGAYSFSREFSLKCLVRNPDWHTAATWSRTEPVSMMRSLSMSQPTSASSAASLAEMASSTSFCLAADSPIIAFSRSGVTEASPRSTSARFSSRNTLRSSAALASVSLSAASGREKPPLTESYSAATLRAAADNFSAAPLRARSYGTDQDGSFRRGIFWSAERSGTFSISVMRVRSAFLCSSFSSQVCVRQSAVIKS